MFKKMIKNDDALGLLGVGTIGPCFQKIGIGCGGCFEACFTGFARIFGK